MEVTVHAWLLVVSSAYMNKNSPPSIIFQSRPAQARVGTPHRFVGRSFIIARAWPRATDCLVQSGPQVSAFTAIWTSPQVQSSPEISGYPPTVYTYILSSMQYAIIMKRTYIRS